MESKRVCHIIVAAGRGSRFGSEIPKQFCDMGGRPVLMETVDRIRRFGGHDAAVVVVISPSMMDEWARMCDGAAFVSPTVAAGGATRWESVRNALETAEALEADIITVHDGARPVVTAELMARVMDVRGHGNIPVTGVTDSLRVVAGDGSSRAVDRAAFRAVQTPQAFRGELLREAYRQPYSPTFTDDASVMEAAGFNDLLLVDGDPRNIKITRPGDIEIARIYLR